MNNVIQFPTDLVRAEVVIDRAHKAWLKARKKELDNRPKDITISSLNTDFSVRCSYVNNDIFFPDYGVAEFYPSIFNQTHSLAELYGIGEQETDG